MDGSEYQLMAKTTMSSSMISKEPNGVLNIILGITGETGELFEEIKKDIEGKKKFNRADVIEESGDLLWYLSALLSAFDIQLNEVMERNLKKIAERNPNLVQVPIEKRLSLKVPLQYFEEMQAKISGDKELINSVMTRCAEIYSFEVNSKESLFEFLKYAEDSIEEAEQYRVTISKIEEMVTKFFGKEVWGDELVKVLEHVFDSSQATNQVIVSNPADKDKIESMRKEIQRLERENNSLRSQNNRLQWENETRAK